MNKKQFKNSDSRIILNFFRTHASLNPIDVKLKNGSKFIRFMWGPFCKVPIPMHNTKRKAKHIKGSNFSVCVLKKTSIKVESKPLQVKKLLWFIKAGKKFFSNPVA